MIALRSGPMCVPAAFVAWILVLAGAALAAPSTTADGWEELAPGLELGAFATPGEADRSGEIHVVRVDPELWEPVLLNTSAPGEGELHTAREWCRLKGMTAAVNASMFQTDYRRSVSLMRTRDHVNSSYLSKDNCVLAFDPLEPDLPPLRLVDRTCDDLEAATRGYGTLVQSIRMISCRGHNVWGEQKRRHSIAAIGVDHDGRLLMIHCRRPYSTHDFIDILLRLPLDIDRCMYTEGGPEAQLYVGVDGNEREFVGSYESGFLESDLNRRAWPVPNVIAVRPR